MVWSTITGFFNSQNKRRPAPKTIEGIIPGPPELIIRPKERPVEQFAEQEPITTEASSPDIVHEETFDLPAEPIESPLPEVLPVEVPPTAEAFEPEALEPEVFEPEALDTEPAPAPIPAPVSEQAPVPVPASEPDPVPEPEPPLPAAAPLPKPDLSPDEELEAQWAAIRYKPRQPIHAPEPEQVPVPPETLPNVPSKGEQQTENHDSDNEAEPIVSEASPRREHIPIAFLETAPSAHLSIRNEAGIIPRHEPRTLQATEAGSSERFTMLHTLAQRWSDSIPHREYFVAAGTRAEARRLAPVIRTLRLRFARTTEVEQVCVCAIGEDPVSVKEAFELLGIKVDCTLHISSDGQATDALRVRVLNSFEGLLAQVKPQWIVITGNTLINGMAALAAYHAGMKIARVEGGSHTQEEDDPDEVNKQLVDLFSSVHFAETNSSKEALVHWGVAQESILVIGNTGVDALHEGCARLGLPVGAGSSRSSGTSHVFISVGHRRLSELAIREICRAIGNLSVLVPGLYNFVWSLPGDAQSAETICKLLADVPGLKLLPTASYEQVLRHLSECDFVLTDSQDLQEEAPSLGKPVLMTGPVNDRAEAIRTGIVIPIELSSEKIQSAVRALARKLSTRHGQVTNPYGDGRASSRIADFLEGKLVLEFGRTALPRLFASPDEPVKQLPAPATAWRLG